MQDLIEQMDNSIVNGSDLFSGLMFDYKSVKIGTYIPGAGKVSRIYAQYENFMAVYIEKTLGLHYFWAVDNPNISNRMHKLSSAYHSGESKLKGVATEKSVQLHLSALTAIFGGASEEDVDAAIIRLKDFIDNLKGVKEVVVKCNGFAVWFDDDDEIDFEYAEDLPVAEFAAMEFAKMYALSVAVLPKSYTAGFKRRLAAALAAAFASSTKTEVLDIFYEIKRYVFACVENSLRLRYLMAMSVATLGLIVVMYVMYRSVELSSFVRIGLIGVAGGFLGTFVSVLERSKGLSINDNESPNLIIVQGIVRVCLGGVFGLVAYAAARAGVAFSVLQDSQASLLLLGIAAGFSERKIPDLIDGVMASKVDVEKK